MNNSSPLKIHFCGQVFSSPLVLPSGILTAKNDFLNAQRYGAGAVTTKSYTYFPRVGHPPPTVARYDCGFINSVGLRNAGIAEAKKQIKEFQKDLKITFFISLFDTNIKDFSQLVLHLLPLRPKFIELNLSCPNVDDEFGKSLANQSESAYQVVKKIKTIVGDKIKIIAKLTPNVPNIRDVAIAVESAGADAINAINTVGPGMLIDIKAHKPILGASQGGLSGPAIKSIALRCVYDIYEAVNIPIIGTGGISAAKDAIEMFMAGATMIGVGSAIYTKGLKVYTEINEGIKKYLVENHYKSIKDLIGLAH